MTHATRRYVWSTHPAPGHDDLSRGGEGASRRLRGLWHLLGEALARPGLVEVGDVLAERPAQVRLGEEQPVVEASRRTLRRKRSTIALVRDARMGMRTTVMPLAAATWAKRAPYLRSLS